MHLLSVEKRRNEGAEIRDLQTRSVNAHASPAKRSRRAHAHTTTGDTKNHFQGHTIQIHKHTTNLKSLNY